MKKRSIYLQITLALPVLVLLMACGSPDSNVAINSEYIWNTKNINVIFKDSCINSENWKDKDPGEVMIEDRSLSVTKFIDTSEFTSIPTALVIGFCSIGEGSGWGNELFLVGHNPKIEKQDYVIEEIFDELQGLTIDSEEIKIENDGVYIKIKGYSSESEPKCCRDAMDEALIGFEKDLPVLKVNSTNSYQLREMQNLQ